MRGSEEQGVAEAPGRAPSVLLHSTLLSAHINALYFNFLCLFFFFFKSNCSRKRQKILELSYFVSNGHRHF